MPRHQSFNPFGKENEVQVGTLPHHIPAFLPPFVRFLHQKIH
jgi:hypothetical protein